MKSKLVKSCILVVSATLIGGLSLATASALRAPGLYTDPTFILSQIPSFVIVDGLIYSLIPSLIVLCVRMNKKSKWGLIICTLPYIGWLALIFLVWARKPWHVYGDFPLWAFQRHFLDQVPPMLVPGVFLWFMERRSTAAG